MSEKFTLYAIQAIHEINVCKIQAPVPVYLQLKPLPDMLILCSSNSAAKKDMMSKI